MVKTKAAIPTLVLVLAGELACQSTRPAGAVSYDSGQRLVCHLGAAYEAKWSWPTSVGVVSGAAAVPIDLPGAACALSQNTVAITGIDTASRGIGHVVVIDFQDAAGAGPTIQDLTLPDVDITALHFDGTEGLVYGYDQVGTRILVAATPLSARTVWGVAATAKECPILSDPRRSDDIQIVGASDRLGVPGLQGVIVRVDPKRHQSVGAPEFHCVQAGGGWTVTQLRFPGSTSIPSVWITGHRTFVADNNRDWSLKVGGPLGQFGIQDMQSGRMVWAGTRQTAAVEEFLVPHGALEHGKRYQILSLAGQPALASRPFRVVPRWARAVHPADVHPGDIYANWDFPTAGEGTFSWQVVWGGLQAPPTGPILATIALGSWAPGLSPTSGVPPLLSHLYGTLRPRVLHFSWSRSAPVAAWRFHVHDSDLAGSLVALQGVALLPTGELVLSDVQGLILQ